MSGTPDTELVALLDTLCPMHAVIDANGHIVHAGPTLRRTYPARDVTGTRFLELFELRRPRLGPSVAALREAAGTKLHFRRCEAPRIDLKGLLVPMPEGGAVINLSFGISVIDAVREFDLTSADFAATDLTVEMLYLVEAKSAAMEASRKLNLRLQGAMIAAEEQAFTDTLTGLKNRRALTHVLERLVAARCDFALMTLDLDYFKAVNDSLGHGAGDHVLQHVARVMVETTRGEDTVVRTGGDEFVLILGGLRDRDRVADIAGRLIARLEEPILYDGESCRISASIGATLSRDYAAPDCQQMMTDADIALYAAKRRGRGCHVIYDPALRGEPEE